MSALRTLLESAAQLRVPDQWAARAASIGHEREVVDRLLSAVPQRKIYGFNTMSGHREADSLTAREMSLINSQILTSHCIGDESYFDPFAARCIGFARVYALAAGGSGITEQFYRRLFDVVTSPTFRPQIPKRVSYSSGDVIAGAHWVQGVLAHLGMDAVDLQPGEVMALINGCSVQVGAAVASIPALETLWCAFGESSEMLYSCAGIRRDSLYGFHEADRSGVAKALDELSKRLHAKDIVGASTLQESVSIRAFPQFLELLHASIADYVNELNILITSPSCNPLFRTADPYYISQASFLAPILTNRLSAIIDAVLFILSGIVGRLAFLLGGSVPGIHVDGADAHDLGIIQVPKLLTAELDAIRMTCGTRWSISHISTSYGIEDVASYGLIEIGRLHHVVDGALEILRGEMAALSLVSEHQGRPQRRSSLCTSKAQHFVERRNELRSVDFATHESWMLPFFPGELGDWRGDVRTRQ